MRSRAILCVRGNRSARGRECRSARRLAHPPATISPILLLGGKNGQPLDDRAGDEVRGVRLVNAVAAAHGPSVTKHSFADKCVPKCNLGTRKNRQPTTTKTRCLQNSQ